MNLTAKSALFFILLHALLVGSALAQQQVLQPNNKYIFEEDDNRYQDREIAERKNILSSGRRREKDIDFQAPEIEILQDEEAIIGRGGVALSTMGMQVQAEKGKYYTKEDRAELEGDVIITRAEGTIFADKADLNLETEAGEFEGIELGFEDQNYQARAEQATKHGEFSYTLLNSWLTTCSCPPGKEESGWQLECSKANITEDGYAHTYNTRFRLLDIPLFYTPWLAFPVKNERQSGLLAPQLGYGDPDGFSWSQPIYVVFDDSSDALVRPFIQARTRMGTSLDLRRAFSQQHSVESRFVYSNERPRDGNLRGTIVDGLADPTFDEDRFGGYYLQRWNTDSDVLVPTQFLADIHYVSDDLFLREFNDSDIGERQARYTTSTLSLRSSIGDVGALDIMGEYNQAMQTEDDIVIQRLPEMALDLSETWRPFGLNPLGMRVRTSFDGLVSFFDRDRGYDGRRVDLAPQIAIPFRFKNYLQNEIQMTMRQTYYSQDDSTDPFTGEELDLGTSRNVLQLNYQATTAVERIYDVDPDGWLSTLTRFGVGNEGNYLKRVKHTIEPLFRFNFVPDEEQEDLPLYSSIDRIRQRSLMTYGVRTRLLGSFRSVSGAVEEIPELAPELGDLPSLDVERPLSLLGGPIGGFGTIRGPQLGSPRQTRDLLSLGIMQSYDYFEDQDDLDPGRDAFSDIALDVSFFPSSAFGISFDTNYDPDKTVASSWGLSAHVLGDRGDALRLRYSYINDVLSQIEGSAEVVLTDQWGVGYYGRYDATDAQREFLENQVAVRFESACRCWMFDVGYLETLNPGREQFFLRLTLRGLGAVTQKMGIGNQNQQP